MKHLLQQIKKTDLLFLGLGIIFIGVCLAELIRLLGTYYSFSRASILFVLMTLLYSIWRFDLMQARNRELAQKSIRGFIQDNHYIAGSYRFLERYKNHVMYLCFSLLAIGGFVSLFLPDNNLVKGFLFVFIGIYIFMKILGFSFPVSFIKSDLKNNNIFRLFLISFALYIIVIGLIFHRSSISQELQSLLYIFLGGAYLVVGAFLLFSWKIKDRIQVTRVKKNFFGVYNILSVFMVLGLIALIGYQNYFIEDTSIIDSQDDIKVTEDKNFGNQQDANQLNNEAENLLLIQDENIISDEGTIENQINIKKVAEIYDITPGIQLGSSGDSVSNLQIVLTKLGYYEGDISGEFDEPTRQGLITTLRTECDWPESTRGIFGVQSKACIDGLDISLEEISSIEPEITGQEGEPVETPIEETQDQQEQKQTENTTQESQEALEEGVQEEQEEQVVENSISSEDISFETRRVADIYSISPGIELGSRGVDVENLQTVLGTLQYYVGDVTGEFDEVTRLALIDALQKECFWPASTKGILGPLAKTCIDNLNIPVFQN